MFGGCGTCTGGAGNTITWTDIMFNIVYNLINLNCDDKLCVKKGFLIIK